MGVTTILEYQINFTEIPKDWFPPFESIIFYILNFIGLFIGIYLTLLIMERMKKDLWNWWFKLKKESYFKKSYNDAKDYIIKLKERWNTFWIIYRTIVNKRTNEIMNTYFNKKVKK